MTERWEIREGDALAMLRRMDAGSVQTCVTSPPYWGLRDYGVAGQLGAEKTPAEYVARLVDNRGTRRHNDRHSVRCTASMVALGA